MDKKVDSLENKLHKNMHERICRFCGNSFLGGSRAWYCPDCKIIRRQKLQKEYYAKKAVTARKIGSVDICEICGKEYIVNGGLQKYCKNCAIIMNQKKENIYKKYENYNMEKLSKREIRILKARISGLSISQIAEIEKNTKKTISNTLYLVKNKLENTDFIEKIKNYRRDYWYQNRKTFKRENDKYRNIQCIKNKNGNKYKLSIKVNYKPYYIKIFDDIDDAIKMRDYVENIRDEDKENFEKWYNDFVKNGRVLKGN